MKVSICCLTYNHEEFIKYALDGFLMQVTDFQFEILIHDDASIDGTADILRKYQSDHGDVINAIFQKENQYSQGKNVIQNLFDIARGKYIALCEGDDYWTDPLKLQKQVEFLESHPDHVLCFHEVSALYQKTNSLVSPKIIQNISKKNIKLKHLVRNTIIHTSSVLFKNILDGDYYHWGKRAPYGDWFTWMWLATRGKVGYLDQVMSVYRIHGKGTWTGDNAEARRNKLLKMYTLIPELLGPGYKKPILCGISDANLSYANALANQGLIDQAKHYLIESIIKCPLNGSMRISDKTVLLIKLYVPKLYTLIKHFL